MRSDERKGKIALSAPPPPNCLPVPNAHGRFRPVSVGPRHEAPLGRGKTRVFLKLSPWGRATGRVVRRRRGPEDRDIGHAARGWPHPRGDGIVRWAPLGPNAVLRTLIQLVGGGGGLGLGWRGEFNPPTSSPNYSQGHSCRMPRSRGVDGNHMAHTPQNWRRPKVKGNKPWASTRRRRGGGGGAEGVAGPGPAGCQADWLPAVLRAVQTGDHIVCTGVFGDGGGGGWCGWGAAEGRRVWEVFGGNKGAEYCGGENGRFANGSMEGVNRHTVWTHAPMRRMVDMTRQDVPTLHSRAHVEGPS